MQFAFLNYVQQKIKDMKKTGIILLLVLASVAYTNSIQAQNYKTALGIRFSSHDATINNSLSLKYFVNSSTAVEALFSFSDPVAIGALLEKHNALSGSGQGLTWFYGAGLFVGFGGTRNFGPQGIVGLDYKFTNIPLNLSLDWKPELSIVKDFSFEPAAIGASVRFTFN